MSRSPQEMGLELIALVKAQDSDLNKALALIDEAGADLEVMLNGQSPLSYACETGQRVLAQKMIERGADVNATDNMNWTPLMAAARYGHVEVIDMLIAQKADLEVRARPTRTAGLETALGLAVEFKNYSCAKLLVRAGAMLDAQDIFGKTALMKAAINYGHDTYHNDMKDENLHPLDGRLDMISFLLAAGVDYYLVCNAGQDVIDKVDLEVEPICQLINDAEERKAESAKKFSEWRKKGCPVARSVPAKPLTLRKHTL